MTRLTMGATLLSFLLLLVSTVDARLPGMRCVIKRLNHTTHEIDLLLTNINKHIPYTVTRTMQSRI